MDYIVNEDGTVFSVRAGRNLKPCNNGVGYLHLEMGRGNKHYLHRLVAQKFVPNPNNLPEVNHKDGNKLNCAASNLEWVSRKSNAEHAAANALYAQGVRCYQSKLSEEQVRHIRGSSLPLDVLAEMYGVHFGTISKVKLRKTYKSVV